jgi:hypothetical protein
MSDFRLVKNSSLLFVYTVFSSVVCLHSYQLSCLFILISAQFAQLFDFTFLRLLNCMVCLRSLLSCLFKNSSQFAQLFVYTALSPVGSVVCLHSAQLSLLIICLHSAQLSLLTFLFTPSSNCMCAHFAALLLH